MSEIIMNYNFVDTSSMLKVLKVHHSIGNERIITTNSSPKLGVIFQEVKEGAKIIEVEISLASFDLSQIKFVDTIEPSNINFGTIHHVREQVAGLFHRNEPTMLTFSDEPDRYYNAIVFDKSELQGITSWYDRAKIKFLVPDGVSHSSTYKKVTDYVEQDGKIIFTLENNGTVEALPIITAKMNSENGFLGIVNQTGVMEIGDREIVDSETLAFSERPFDYSETGTGIADGLAKGTKNVAILNDTSQVLDKNLSIINWNGRDHLVLDGTQTAGTHAGSLTFDLPTVGSLYDYFWWRQVFWAGALNQYGFIKISISDTEGKFLYGVETIKRKNSLETEYNFFVTDGQGGYKQTSFAKKFNATHLDNDNPFNVGRGWSDILRKDDEVSLFWFGSRIPMKCPELKGKKSAKLHVALGSLNGKPLVTRMYLDGIKYRKDNVGDSYNIPNPYDSGSTMVINTENKTMTVDNIPLLNDVVNYSKWLKIPPGTSTMEFTTSSWTVNKPTISIAFEERRT